MANASIANWKEFQDLGNSDVACIVRGLKKSRFLEIASDIASADTSYVKDSKGHRHRVETVKDICKKHGISTSTFNRLQNDFDVKNLNRFEKSNMTEAQKAKAKAKRKAKKKAKENESSSFSNGSAKGKGKKKAKELEEEDDLEGVTGGGPDDDALEDAILGRLSEKDLQVLLEKKRNKTLSGSGDSDVVKRGGGSRLFAKGEEYDVQALISNAVGSVDHILSSS